MKREKKCNYTIKDIAREAGISVTTASFVLNGQDKQYGIKQETADRVREIIQRKKFRPNYGARILTTGRSRTFAFIAPTIADGFYNEIVVSMESEALRAGFQLVLCNSLDDVQTEEIHLKNLIERRVDGLVLAPVDLKAKHLDLLKQESVRAVLLCPPDPDMSGYWFADFDLQSAPRLAVEHLLKKGCRKIVLLDWDPLHPHTSWTRNRSVLRQAFIQTLRENKLTSGKENIWTLFGEKENPNDETDFKSRLQKIKPDAVVAMRDVQLLRAWKPLSDAGFSVPKDIRLVGCDDISLLQYWSPAISTVSMPKTELGKYVIKVLLDKAEKTENRIFPITLVERTSSS